MLKKQIFKSAYGKIGLVLILLFCGLLSLRVGSAELSSAQFFGGLLGKEEFETARIILLELRLLDEHFLLVVLQFLLVLPRALR